MKKTIAAIGCAVILFGLTGCGDKDRPRYKTSDELYQMCLDHGGTFEYNGSLPYYKCKMPQTKEAK